MTEVYYQNFGPDPVWGHDHVVYKEAKFLINKRYQIRKFLGKGSYGTVCAAVDTAGPDVKLAIKKVSNIFAKEVLMKRTIRELKLLKHFRGHKNVSIPTFNGDIEY